ncbi:hypothetical protein NDU88_002148 [Pleurodeles waltl]|uniref:Uncharacterized protein n=1 Tax=Pleurodeles waltl TaxID=8319 RepID=A0AAV7UA76_PLEWA|nr:hypothetical protein NDU88_002148 [Pleurodeles waltl]
MPRTPDGRAGGRRCMPPSQEVHAAESQSSEERRSRLGPPSPHLATSRTLDGSEHAPCTQQCLREESLG